MFYKVLFSVWHLCEKQTFAEWAVGSNGTVIQNQLNKLKNFQADTPDKIPI